MKNQFVVQFRNCIYFVCMAALFVTGQVSSNTVSTELVPTAELIKALQSGGHIIYMRHGPTEHTQKDKNRDTLEDCSSQRNLSIEGREILTQIGNTIKVLNIPIGGVLSSPYCRCKDTAQIVFEKFNTNSKLIFSMSKDQVEAKQLGENLYKMMINSTVSEKNEIFVGHTSNLKDGLGIWPKPEGVMVIFQKRDDQLIYKGMISPDTWAKQ